MDAIRIKDLAVLCHIGVPEEERSKPQRLLITVEMNSDFSKACLSDDIVATINYYEVSKRVTELCSGRSFKLIENLAHEIASMVLNEFGPEAVTVEVKKFILPNARYVSFELTRSR
jgi:FolB domain-containing protein